ncbi:MAG: hypothetical protein IJY90_02600 [Clostridia bacterium]|nr:hypothetical protein [Clostridia bacterium]
MKSKKLSIAAILGSIGATISVIVATNLLIWSRDIISMLVLSILFMAINFLAMIVNFRHCIGIGANNLVYAMRKTRKDFNDKYIILLAAIFNVALLIFQFVVLILGLPLWLMIILIVAMGLEIAATVLYFIELVGKTNIQKVVVSRAEELQRQDKQQNDGHIENKLHKIEHLKQTGLLTDEEYNEIKQDCINKYLDK